MDNLFRELRRRNVFRVAGVYAVVGWLLVQVSGALENAIGLPTWFDGFVVALLVIVFPIALLLAWALEMTPEGLKRTKDLTEDEIAATPPFKGSDLVIIAGLVGVIAVGGWQQLSEPKINYPNNLGEEIVDTASVPGSIDSETLAEPTSTLQQRSVDLASIAVLPFADLSPDADQEYFSDGISEEILNSLVRVEGLSVASRTSAFRFKGETKSIPVIAGELNVAHVLEGSVRKAGDRIRISAQLIDAGNDVQLWSDTFDRELTVENIFEIQDEIAREIVTALESRMSTGTLVTDSLERALSSKSAPEDLDAYDLYLQVRASAYEEINQQTVEEGIVLLARAIELAPAFTDAHVEYAFWLSGLPSWDDAIDKDEYLAQAWQINERALEQDPNHVGAIRVRAGILAGRYEWGAALEEARRAVALAPRRADVHFTYGMILSALGYSDEAVTAIKRAVELEKAYPLYHNFLGLALAANGQFDAAKSTLIEGYEFGYGGWAEGALGELYLRSGDILAYRFLNANLYRSQNLEPLGRKVAGLRLASTDDFDAAKSSFWQLAEELGYQRETLLKVLGRGALHPIDIAHLGEDQAFARPFPLEYYPWFWGPAYDDLRDSEGLKDMLRIAQLPEYWRDHGWPEKCRPIGENDFTCRVR